MQLNKVMMALAAGSLAIAVQALTLSVTDVKIAQRYPWNGLVDIDYTVVCDEPTTNIWVYPVGHDVDFNTSVALRTLEGDGVNGQPVVVGAEGQKTFRMTWNMAADMPENYNRAKFSVKMYAYAGAAPYMVIDLSPGPDAERYNVTYLSGIPGGEWSDLYKTTNLVLKLVCPGTFMMGSPVDELGRDASMEMLHSVTLTQPFYMGVFELTQEQYKLIMGSNPSRNTGGNRPVEWVNYNTIRGSSLGSKWPEHSQVDADSFFGKLRMRTGITFDLPTEAEWEYTCRAGTGTALNSGTNLTSRTECPNMAEVGRYYYNRSDGKGGYAQHTVVGMYRENAWGFYDMHGNVAEWCRDWWVADLTKMTLNPKGASSGYYRVKRGGSWGYSSAVGPAWTCRSAYRHTSWNYFNVNASTPDAQESDWGFRVAAYPAE